MGELCETSVCCSWGFPRKLRWSCPASTNILTSLYNLITKKQCKYELWGKNLPVRVYRWLVAGLPPCSHASSAQTPKYPPSSFAPAHMKPKLLEVQTGCGHEEGLSSDFTKALCEQIYNLCTALKIYSKLTRTGKEGRLCYKPKHISLLLAQSSCSNKSEWSACIYEYHSKSQFTFRCHTCLLSHPLLRSGELLLDVIF